MLAIIVRKRGYGFEGRQEPSEEPYIRKGTLPCLIGTLVIANAQQCWGGLVIKWDEDDPETKKYLHSRKRTF